MRKPPALSAARSALMLALILAGGVLRCDAAGVTVITHGLNGDTDGWITGMADRIPHHERFSGTNFTGYKMYFVSGGGGSWLLTAARVAGAPPSIPESGEIIVKLDWNQLADGNSYNTYQIATAVVPALLNTNFIPELGGRALAEFPLHLIGHSRGGSLACEMSRLLGTNGVWVDQLTTLDPHPLNGEGFELDALFYSDVDAPDRTYSTVLFHDNAWQEVGFGITGEDVAGAYVRELTNLDGGYGGLTGPHSDVHLWYHGTIDSGTPASDTEASIGSSQRQNWWVASESQGAIAGFHYSLIGGGDRLSSSRPLGAGFPAIHDGFNQWWDLGAGTAANRTVLSTNHGHWPSLIRLNRMATNAVVQGQSTPLRFYYQWARPNTNIATVRLYLDEDLNPLNANQTLLAQVEVPGTGAAFVNFTTTNVLLHATNATPGPRAFFATITGNGRTRYLYAPEPVEVVGVPQPPTLRIAKIGATQYRIEIEATAGQTIVLESSSDLLGWSPMATNTLTSALWVHTNNAPAGVSREFYRAVRTP